MAVSRLDPEERRSELIAATLELIGEAGIGAATVRDIARRAGVTQGLIRHHFSTKEDLIAAAFERHAQKLMEGALAVGGGDEPALDRLRRFVERSLRPPSIGPEPVSLWAAFMSLVQTSPTIRNIHIRTYRQFRDRLEELISEARADCGRPVTAGTSRAMAITANAIIDGLWLEGSALPEQFESDELVALGCAAVGAVCGLDLEVEAGVRGARP
ncbi:MAG: TetR family transcriptional regulator [Rhizobiales bacterium]|nr:TetR family transcriptional regulator [Hyphomicrobiales bacterium]